MIAIALVALVLMQRSEGGALGIGGGGGLMTGRGAANVLTRTTTILAISFFATSIALTVLPTLFSDRGAGFGGGTAGAPTPSGAGTGLLKKLDPTRATKPKPAKAPAKAGGAKSGKPAVPQGQ